MHLLQSTVLLVIFGSIYAAEVEGSGETKVEGSGEVKVTVVEGSGVVVEGSGEVQSEVLIGSVEPVVLLNNDESNVPAVEEVQIDGEPTEVAVKVVESIDGEVPSVELVDPIVEQKKEEVKKENERRRHPFGDLAKKFFGKLNEEKRKEFAGLFKKQNVSREDRKKQIDAFLAKTGASKDFEELKKRTHAHKEKSRKRLTEAVNSLPAALVAFHAIIDDKSLGPKEVGQKVKELIKSLSKDTTKALFTLKKNFDKPPRRFTNGLGKRNFGKKPQQPVKFEKKNIVFTKDIPRVQIQRKDLVLTKDIPKNQILKKNFALTKDIPKVVPQTLEAKIGTFVKPAIVADETTVIPTTVPSTFAPVQSTISA